MREANKSILKTALDIASEYKAQGMTLTLRQMYYQFVARGLIESGQRHYSRIGSILTKARYEGSFPLDMILDRGREVHLGRYLEKNVDVDDAKHRAADAIERFPEIFLKVDKWHGQPNFVSVWVEKQALEGVFEPICEELGVSWFACKGYPSVSALNDWLNHASDVCGSVYSGDYDDDNVHAILQDMWDDREEISDNGGGEIRAGATVLYFGDHDPDGWEIPRSAERNIRKLMAVNDMWLPITFKRIALNMQQIKQYNPPPFDAKVTSSRYKSYVKEHSTRNAWELDALEPTVLRALIKKNVQDLFDKDIGVNNQVELMKAREKFRKSFKENL